DWRGVALPCTRGRSVTRQSAWSGRSAGGDVRTAPMSLHLGGCDREFLSRHPEGPAPPLRCQGQRDVAFRQGLGTHRLDGSRGRPGLAIWTKNLRDVGDLREDTLPVLDVGL